MAKLTVAWTQTAVHQRKLILSYWLTQNQSVEYPRKLIGLISRRVEQIASHPLGFPAVDFPNTRACSLGHYSIFYQVHEDCIIITASDTSCILSGLGSAEGVEKSRSWDHASPFGMRDQHSVLESTSGCIRMASRFLDCALVFDSPPHGSSLEGTISTDCVPSMS